MKFKDAAERCFGERPILDEGACFVKAFEVMSDT